MPKRIKRTEGIQVVIVVLPPDSPGASKRLTLDLGTSPVVLGYQVANEVQKLIKKTQPKAEKTGAPAAA